MGTLNFNVRRGETLDRTCIWWKARNVTARDLTGYALRLQIRSAPGGTLYADLSIGSGITMVNAAAGVFRIIAATAAWTFDQAVFDLKATDPGSLFSYPIDGQIFVVNPVTP